MTMRHYAKFRNEEVIILGYKASMNSVMITRVTMLPGDDQSVLRQIASSIYAQDKCDYLVTVLQSERHKSGTDWFTYLATRLQRNDGSVSVIPLKELADMNPDQRAFFKGWGKTIDEAGEKAQAEEHIGMGSSVMGEDYKPTLDPSATVGPSGVPFQPTPDSQNKLMMDMIAQMAASQAALTETVSKLAAQVNTPKPARKKAVRKKVVSKKSASAA